MCQGRIVSYPYGMIYITRDLYLENYAEDT